MTCKEISLLDDHFMYGRSSFLVSSKINRHPLHQLSNTRSKYRAMPTPPASPSYANIAALAGKSQSIHKAQSANRPSANTSHEPHKLPRAQAATRSIVNSPLEPQALPRAEPANNPRERRTVKQLPYMAPGRRTSTSQATRPSFSASEVEQLNIPKGPAADNWRTGTSRDQSTDRYRPQRGRPSQDLYRPTYADSQSHTRPSYPSSREWDTPRNHGSERHGNLQDLRSERHSPYSKDRGYAPRPGPSSHRAPVEPDVISVTLPANGPEDQSHDVNMAWHCKLPKTNSELKFVREYSARYAKEQGADSVRVRMGIHDTKIMKTERGLESVAGEPFHFTIELQKDHSSRVDTSHIYTDTRTVDYGPGGKPIYQTIGLATAGVTKGANGKVVDQVIETFKNGTRRAVGFSNRTEKINWEYTPDLNNLNY